MKQSLLRLFPISFFGLDLYMFLPTDILIVLVSLTQSTPGATRPPLSTSRTLQPDGCRDLCEVLEADLRGNGFDLCDPFQSSCTYTDPTPSCLYLYWSVTDDGQRGIIYSVDGSDLTETERSNPVSCDEATNIAWSD